jgi:hypothetical protein
MKHILIGISLFVALCAAAQAQEDTKDKIKDAAHETGQDIKKAAHEVKEGVKSGAHKVASMSKEGAHEVAHVAKEGAHAVATTAKEVKNKAIVQCGNGDHAVRREGACDHAGGTARSPQ